MDITTLIQSYAELEFLRGNQATFLVWASMALIAVAFNRRISLIALGFTYLGFSRLSLDTLPPHWAFSKLILGIAIVLIGWQTVSPNSKFETTMHLKKRMVFSCGVAVSTWILYWFDIWSITGLPKEWNLAILSSLGMGIWLFMFLSEPLHRLFGFIFLLLGIDLLLSYSTSTSGALFLSAVFQVATILCMPFIYKSFLRPLRTI